jgi:hypothetical protein
MVLSAQNPETNGVTISNFAVDAGTVTFEVSWINNRTPGFVWSDTVWLFVDYNDQGVMRRLPLTGATLLETSAPGYGRVIEEPGNTSGVWVVGNARNTILDSFSAKVQLLTTENVAGGACVYASNYPPVGQFTTGKDIAFAGTPMYNLTFDDGERTFTLPSGSTYVLPPNYTLLSFVDATGAPGIIVSHVDYCFNYNPGKIVGDGEIIEVEEACVVYYSAGVIGSEGDMLPGCARYMPGVVGGLDDAPPGCATYRAGSIGGLPFVRN